MDWRLNKRSVVQGARLAFLWASLIDHPVTAVLSVRPFPGCNRSRAELSSRRSGSGITLSNTKRRSSQKMRISSNVACTAETNP